MALASIWAVKESSYLFTMEVKQRPKVVQVWIILDAVIGVFSVSWLADLTDVSDDTSYLLSFILRENVIS